MSQSLPLDGALSDDCNISLRWQVRDLGTGETLLTGERSARADAVTALGLLPYTASRQSLYHITWQSEHVTGENHYLAGNPPFSLQQYRAWIRALGWQDEGAR